MCEAWLARIKAECSQFYQTLVVRRNFPPWKALSDVGLISQRFALPLPSMNAHFFESATGNPPRTTKLTFGCVPCSLSFEMQDFSTNLEKQAETFVQSPSISQALMSVLA
jgi:hypothetical protein